MEQEAQKTKTGRDGAGQRTKEAAALKACRYVLIHQTHWPPLCLLQRSNRPQRSPRFLCNCGPTLRSAEAQENAESTPFNSLLIQNTDSVNVRVCVSAFAAMSLLLASLCFSSCWPVVCFLTVTVCYASCLLTQVTGKAEVIPAAPSLL